MIKLYMIKTNLSKRSDQSSMVIEVGRVGVQEVINGYRSSLLVPKGLYCAWKWCRLTADGVIHDTRSTNCALV